MGSAMLQFWRRKNKIPGLIMLLMMIGVLSKCHIDIAVLLLLPYVFGISYFL